jgi:hypothetical protein
MRKFIRTFLFLTLVLSACSPAALSPIASPLTTASDTPLPAVASTTEAPPAEVIPVSTTEVVLPPKIITTLSTPHIDQGPDGIVTAPPTYPRDCGYQWAQQSLPELSSQFMQSIQALQADAQASAFVFGENCVYADGTSTFIPMETDFNITLPVRDTTDTVLGEGIVRIMQVIEDIPPDRIIGPRPGRVAITFEVNGQRQGITFYIDQYRALPAGLSPAEIYQTLKSFQ